MTFNKVGLLIVLLLLSKIGFGQRDRYVVHFKDKNNSTYSINKADEFLSQRALDKRSAENIVIDSLDLPVSTAYLDSLSELNIEFFYTSKWFNAVLVQIDESQKEDLLSRTYVTDVEFVAPGIKATKGVNNTDFSGAPIETSNPNRLSTDVQNSMIGIDKMHQAGFKGEGMLVAVFDGGFTGVNTISAFKHLFDNQQIVKTFDYLYNELDVYSYSNHGTFVLSTMAAIFKEEFVGGVPNANYILCVTEDDEEFANEHRVEEYNWLFAAEMADSAGVDVINSSVGYTTFEDPSMDYVYDNLNGSTAVVSRAASIASSRGIIVVSSAGNEGNKAWRFIAAPADAENIISVGSVTSSRLKSNFSSFGPTSDGRIKPDLVAKGSSAVVIDSNGNVVTRSGTSFAAPILAGMVTGYWQSNPEMTGQEVIEKLKSTASRHDQPDNSLGYGIPNFEAAANNEAIILGIGDNADFFKVYPNPIHNETLIVETSQHDIKEVTIQLYSITGREIPIQPVFSSKQKVHIPVNVAKGSYILKIFDGVKSHSYKLMR